MSRHRDDLTSIMRQAQPGKDSSADWRRMLLAVLLVVGFELIMFGVICFAMKSTKPVGNAQAGLKLLMTKVGVVLVALGMLHFLLLMILSGIREGHAAIDSSSEPRHSISQLSDLSLRGR